MATCSDCRGTGAKVLTRRMGNMLQQQRVQCDACNGTGENIAPRDRCKTCNGAKTVSENKILKVEIDKGMKEGKSPFGSRTDTDIDKKIIFRGESNEEPGCVTGDVIFVIKEAEHKLFHRYLFFLLDQFF